MAALPTRKLGKDDVTALGYGAMGIASYYGTVDSDEDRLNVCYRSFSSIVSVDNRNTQFLDELYASGCRNWDTANIYGDSEVLLGKWCDRSTYPRYLTLIRWFFLAGSRERASAVRFSSPLNSEAPLAALRPAYARRIASPKT